MKHKLLFTLIISFITFVQAQTITTISSRVTDVFGTDFFGSRSSISANGNRIAIAALGKETSTLGYVKIFDRINNAWAQVGNIISSGNPGDDFGIALSLSADGTTVAVGAPATNQNAGEVRVFRLVGNTWTKIGNNALEGGDPNVVLNEDKFGSSVSLNSDGTILVVGIPRRRSSGKIDASFTKVFQYNGTSWVQVGNNLFSEDIGDNFGSTVSINTISNVKLPN